MNYNPAQYVRPRSGIRAGFGAMGQALAQMPGEIRAEKEYQYLQEQRRIAVEESKKDWGNMEDTWKILKKQYGAMVQPLLDSNQMTFDEYSTNINMIPQPTQADKKDPGQYIDRLGQAYGSLVKEAKKRIRTQEIADTVNRAMEGTPERQVTKPAGREQTISMPTGETFTEQDVSRETIPEVPPARTREGIAGVAGRAGYTQQELLQNPRYASAPTELERQKEERLSKKETRLQDMTEYQEAMMGYRWSKLNYQKTKDVKTLQLAEDRAKTASNNIIAKRKTSMMELDDQIRDLKKGETDPFTQETTIDYEAIGELERKKLQIQDELDQLNAEKKMIGAIPGETRKFSKETGKEKERIGGFKEKVIGPQGRGQISQTLPMSKMEQKIRDSLAGRVSPKVIEEYIAEKKAKGQL